VALDSEGILAGAIMAAGKTDRDALDRLLGPVTEGEAPATENDVMTVRMVAKHG
jgi:hypothetical protein